MALSVPVPIEHLLVGGREEADGVHIPMLDNGSLLQDCGRDVGIIHDLCDVGSKGKSASVADV